MPPVTGVKVRLGGKLRTLRYTARALGRLEDEREEPLAKTLALTSQLSFKAITALVWAGRLHEEPELKMEDVADQIEPPIQSLAEKITEALGPWVTEPEKGEEGKADA